MLKFIKLTKVWDWNAEVYYIIQPYMILSFQLLIYITLDYGYTTSLWLLLCSHTNTITILPLLTAVILYGKYTNTTENKSTLLKIWDKNWIHYICHPDITATLCYVIIWSPTMYMNNTYQSLWKQILIIFFIVPYSNFFKNEWS